jgi:PAS domain S-box-containing protein
MIWTNLPDGETDFVNQRWEQETGLTLKETGAEGWTRILAPEDREECLTKWRHSLDSGETFQAECRLLSTPRGESRWHTCRAVPILDSGGRILRWFGSCMDIHEQKLAAENVRASKEELQLANEALKRSNMDLEQFAYAASHDLQEPLRMVGIYSQLLKEECSDKLDGQGKQYLDFATDGAARMEALLKDLLEYSRAVGPKENRFPEEIDCQEALNEALANMSTLIQETGAEVTRAALPRVHIPKVHLVQVFQNLIGNAIKYRKPTEKPMIHVDARPQDGSWIFSVRDNGIGISPQFQAQIFRIFGRLHGTEMPGTGIGLALCKKLVERAGGTIWVESQPDAGSIFYFTVRA